MMRSFADTFMRILLSIDELQPRVISLLLEKLPEFLGGGGEDGSDDDEYG